MKAWQSIAVHARRGLIALGAALALGLGLVLCAQQWQTRAQRELLSAAGELAAVQARARDRQAELSDVERQSELYWQLVQIGFIAMPEREAWVEQLLASARRTGLSSSLRYTLLAPQPLAPPATPAAAGHDAQFHDLELTLSPVHEEDLLGLLRDLERRPTGPFRVDACQLSEPTPLGLSARCVLRFFTLVPTVPLAVPMKAAAPVSSSPEASWPGLDTLFYAPAERSAMVLERSDAGGQDARRPARLDGIVQRDRGHGTSWINHRAVAEHQPAAPGAPTRISADAIVLDGRHLRVGETLDLATGVRTDLVAPGALIRQGAK